MPRLSIIVPIYNAERYLNRCIESILSQRFADFELLLINDGSTDTSLDICKSYAKNDNRIKVITKDNSGVSATRNIGIDISTGDWITFIDSDDWISENYLGVMNSSIRSDLVVGTVFFKSNGTVGYLFKENFICEGDQYTSILSKECTNPLFNSPWAKFLRKSIIENHNLRFDERLCFGEDAVFVKEYLLHINTLQTDNTIIYNYDDIGDDIYKKYSNSFAPIYDYYRRMLGVYAALENKFKIPFSKKELVGAVYNISSHCLKRDGLKDWNLIRQFLLDSITRKVLRSRGSLHLNNILMLSYDFSGVIFWSYYCFIECIKRLLKN